MEIGKMKITEVLPHLKIVASTYGLKLSLASDFKHARLILANLYNRELI
jgi:hypothetical protein